MGESSPNVRKLFLVDYAIHFVKKIRSYADRFLAVRHALSESCKEIAARWEEIEPPHDYDGPDWR